MEKLKKYLTMSLVSCLLMSGNADTKLLADAESNSHEENASKQQIVNTYKFKNCEVVQFKLQVLSTYSYLLVSNNEAFLIDPNRNIELYDNYLKENKIKLIGVFLTHSHADFVAGHVEAAMKFGVPIYISEDAHAIYPHIPLKDNEVVKVGKVDLKFIATPGHTLDGMCALVYDQKQVELMFSGDMLFVGSIGRPDLMGDSVSAVELASKSYDSWHNKLALLPDDLKFFPAHGAGSLCGAHLRDEPYSTIGQEKLTNPYLQIPNRNTFTVKVINDLAKAPPYFAYNAAMNRKGPELVNWQAPLVKIKPASELSDFNKYEVIDLRDGKKYSAGHIPNSLNIGLRGRLETWLGTLVPFTSELVLIADSDAELQEAVDRLHNIGYKAKTLLISDYQKANLPLKKSGLISVEDLEKDLKSDKKLTVVDVRLPNEWGEVRIGEILNIPLTNIFQNAHKLDPNHSVVTVCNSAYRSSMAIGFLERKKFDNLSSLSGGTEAWIESGREVIKDNAVTSKVAAKAESLKVLPIPEQIELVQLLNTMRDLPNTIELVDIRNGKDFAEFAIPNSKNVEVSELINEKNWRIGEVPLVIIDRDGTIAMAIGAILIRESTRPVKVLRGGINSYWELKSKDENFLRAQEKKIKGKSSQTEPDTPLKMENPKKKTTNPGC